MSSATDRPDAPIHVVVTCANRKSRVVPDDRKFHSLLREGGIRARAAAWQALLSHANPKMLAHELYAGEHWTVARDLAKAVKYGGRLWVASAGYGLLPSDAYITAYAATFAVGHQDSVASRLDDARDWWDLMAAWPGPEPGAPRSFTALAESAPEGTIIAVLSESYLRACARDLARAALVLTNSDALSVFAPPDREPMVDHLIVPVTARLQPVVGGSLQALNVRAAAHVLRAASACGTPPRRSLLSKLSAQAVASAPADSRRSRPGIRLDDIQVGEFIRAEIRLGTGKATATNLLRKLRASGYSCEQARFRDLFRAIMAEAVDGQP